MQWSRKALLTGFAVVALGIIAAGVGLICLQQAAPGTPIIDIPSIPNIIGSSGPYILAAPFPDVNDSYPVYRTVLPDNSTEEKRRIGDLFGVSGDMKKPERTDGRVYYYTNSGAFQYIIPAKAYPYATNRQPDIPSDEEARVIAMDYLKEHGLLSGDIHATGVSVGSSFVDRSAAPGGAEYILTKLVIFVEEIEGLPVQNAGIGVAIGENSEVVAVSNSLREFDPKPIRDVKIITPKQAYQRLSAGDLMIQPLPEDYDKLVVTNISLGYWMATQTEPQNYIVPVYVFSCNAMWDSKSEEVFRYVPAVDPSEVQDLT
jgi:hypothetical protein